MTTLFGIVIPGLGVATRTIAEQRDQFQNRGLPNMTRLQNGTINIDITPQQFTIVKHDYFFKTVPWGNHFVEDFGFIEIEKIIYEKMSYERPGYIYVPHNSPHFKNHSQIEVLSVPVADARVGAKIQILVSEGKISI